MGGRGSGRKRQPNPARDAEIARLHALGLAMSEIADRIGLTRQMVGVILRRLSAASAPSKPTRKKGT